MIVDLVRDRERVTVEFLAQELDSSVETIRRDLTELSARGLVRKFHGGATLWDVRRLGAKLEGSFQSRMLTNLREKRAIARQAASLFSPGDTLFIDTGTTTVLFAEELARLSRLTVITNSVAIAQVIVRGGGNRAFLIGGEYSEDASETVGALAVEQVSRFHPSHVVLTVAALDTRGIMDYLLDEAEIATAMVAHSTHLTVLADSSKFGRAGLFQVCLLSEIDRLITDAEPEETMAEALRHGSVEVIVAGETTPHSKSGYVDEPGARIAESGSPLSEE